MVSANKISANLGGAKLKTPRSSNLELYRIVCMLLIVAHHYVVNSGVATIDGPMAGNPQSASSLFLLLFGAWGKTGINCFLMITGYFMCTSQITMRKFLKLIGQIYLYSFIIFIVLFMGGYETFSIPRMIKLIFPLWGFKNNFVSCFIGFWLTIPFLNILVQNMSKRQHEWLLSLMLGLFTILGSVPTFSIGMEYIIWFGIIFLLASYIRLYPQPLFERQNVWGWMTLLSLIMSVVSILLMQKWFGGKGIKTIYFFVSDSNKIFAVLIAFCSFLWFKNIKLKYSKVINAFGAATFGVLLIHANSNAMRQWLWKDTVDVIGHYQTLSTGGIILYSIGVVLAIFIICNLIDQLRIATLEKWFFRWYDNKLSAKADALIQRFTK